MIKIIDAHAHLWLKQDTVVDGLPIKTRKNGRSLFMDEERQMLQIGRASCRERV